MLNLYDKLGISPDASTADIQVAIKKAAQTESLPLEVLQKANQWLLNSDKRKKYNGKLFAEYPELLHLVINHEFLETAALNYLKYLDDKEETFSYDVIETALKYSLQDLGVSESQATDFARVNYAKISGRCSKFAQAKLGITHYRWRSTCDELTRDEHLMREGRIFAWDNPPPDGHPGYADGCRCHAEPIFPELADLDAALFGDGGDNRHYHAEMTRRGLKPEAGMPPLPDDPYTAYGYLPRGAKLPESTSTPSIQKETTNKTTTPQNLSLSGVIKKVAKIISNNKS